jgi:hypothetical protein
VTRTRRALLLISTLLALALTLPGGLAAEEAAGGDLAWTVGAWKGVRTDGVDGSRVPMNLRVEPILGGAGLAERLEVKQRDGAYRGFAVTAYDQEEKVWVRQYVNSTRGRFVRLVGTVEGDRSTWEPEPPGEGRRSRMVSERLGEGRWRRTQSVSEDGGETWQTLWQDDLEKLDVTRPELREELLGLRDRDQKLRRAAIENPDDEALREELHAFDEHSTARAKAILADGGWPTVKEVGYDGSEALWLLIQHTVDPDFLAAALPAMKEAGERGDLGQNSVATTVDRVRVNRGEPQLYGTQFHEVNGEMVPYPIEDEEHLAERRRELHLIDFEEYRELVMDTYRPTPRPAERGEEQEPEPPR